MCLRLDRCNMKTGTKSLVELELIDAKLKCLDLQQSIIVLFAVVCSRKV